MRRSSSSSSSMHTLTCRQSGAPDLRKASCVSPSLRREKFAFVFLFLELITMLCPFYVHSHTPPSPSIPSPLSSPSSLYPMLLLLPSLLPPPMPKVGHGGGRPDPSRAQSQLRPCRGGLIPGEAPIPPLTLLRGKWGSGGKQGLSTKTTPNSFLV